MRMRSHFPNRKQTAKHGRLMLPTYNNAAMHKIQVPNECRSDRKQYLIHKDIVSPIQWEKPRFRIVCIH